jgi:polysaccharide transporter, PST family
LALWRSVGWLYLIQAVNMLLPLVTVPFLTRTLGADAWGRAAAAQSFALLAGLAVEYGFNFSAVRMVARCRHDRSQLAGTFAAVSVAQLLLLLAVSVAAWLVHWMVPYLAQEPALFWSAMLWMTPQVISFQWYYQGIEQMPRLAALTLLGRVSGLAGLLVLIAGPDDMVLSLAVPGVAGLTAMAAAGLQPLLTLKPDLPRFSEVGKVLAEGLALCGYRLGIALQGAVNTFLLSFFLSPALVGAYAGAERVARAAAGLLEPLIITVFSRLAYLRASGSTADRQAADHWDQRSRLWLTCAGGLLAIALWTAAPWLVRLLLGPGFETSIPILRVLAFSPLAGVLCYGAGLNGLAISGRDRTLNLIVIGAGLLQTLGVVVLGWLVTESLPVVIALVLVTAQFLQWLWLRQAASRPEHHR